MDEKEKDVELEPIEDDELEKVTGGRGGLNPTRVDLHSYDSGVKGRM